MLDPSGLRSQWHIPEKASQPWCLGYEHQVCLSALRFTSETASSKSCWDSCLWPPAKLWPLQQYILPVTRLSGPSPREVPMPGAGTEAASVPPTALLLAGVV